MRADITPIGFPILRGRLDERSSEVKRLRVVSCRVVTAQPGGKRIEDVFHWHGRP